METCIRGEEELRRAFQMDRKLEVNKQTRLEGQGAAGGEFFSSSSQSPSTTSQVCLSCQALCRKHKLWLWLRVCGWRLYCSLELSRLKVADSFLYTFFTWKPVAFTYSQVYSWSHLFFSVKYYKCPTVMVSCASLYTLSWPCDGCHDDINTQELSEWQCLLVGVFFMVHSSWDVCCQQSLDWTIK